MQKLHNKPCKNAQKRRKKQRFMTILIDVDNTLLDFNECANESIKNACARFDIQNCDELCMAFHPFNLSLWQALERKEITLDELLATRFNTLFGMLGIQADGIEFEKLFHDGLANCAVPVDGAGDLLEHLSQKYDLYVASNAPLGQQVRRLKKVDFYKYIKGYFVSAEIGHLKPNKEFFDACFSVLNDNPNDVFMIGDSLTADINGARNYGLKTIWFDKFQSGEKADCDYTVTSLSQIKNIL